MRRTLSAITNDGFAHGAAFGDVTSLALASLRIALTSWFSTYHIFAHNTWRLVEGKKLDDREHSWEYFVLQSEAIVHLQHFAELVCKDILRSEHELLVTIANSDPVMQHRLLNSENVSPQDLKGQRTIEFNEALTALTELTKAERIRRTDHRFVPAHKDALVELNRLRNRLWHRGTYTLRTTALDELFGGHLLPFVRDVTALPEYRKIESIWKPHRLACGIGVLSELRNELKKHNGTPRKLFISKKWVELLTLIHWKRMDLLVSSVIN